MPHPATPEYLNNPYSAKPQQKGGTLIAEDVTTLEEHRRRLAEPDGYRPGSCPRCQSFLHALDLRGRRLRDQPDSAEEDIRRYRCRPCGAVWQVLPGIIARYLHRTWGAVQSALVACGALERTGSERRVRRKPSTLARWLRRLGGSARVLVQVLAGVEGDTVAALKAVGMDCSRRELVEELASAGLVDPDSKLGQLAGWVHRLCPGIRLM